MKIYEGLSKAATIITLSDNKHFTEDEREQILQCLNIACGFYQFVYNSKDKYDGCFVIKPSDEINDNLGHFSLLASQKNINRDEKKIKEQLDRFIRNLKEYKNNEFIIFNFFRDETNKIKNNLKEIK